MWQWAHAHGIHKEGNRWCDDIKNLSELLMMGLACQAILYETIEVDNKVVDTIISRTRENDNWQVVGVNPENPNAVGVNPENPNNELSTLNSSEISIREEYLDQVSTLLKNNIEAINVGLGFFGIHAIINDDNHTQLDFYDKTNALLYSRDYCDDDNMYMCFSWMFDSKLGFKFNDFQKNEVSYSLLNENYHVFVFISPEEDRVCRIEIQKDDNKFSRFMIRIIDKNGNCKNEEFWCSSNYLKVRLDNVFGFYGDRNGIERVLFYSTDCNNSEVSMIEKINQKGNYLYGDGFDDSIRLVLPISDKPFRYDNCSKEQYERFCTSVVTHPRNKELLLFMMNELERQFPGIRDFILQNFPIFERVMNKEYEADDFAEELIEKAINPEVSLVDLACEQEKSEELSSLKK